MSQIVLDYRFTSLNDYILAERSNRHVAAKIKRDETEVVRKIAKSNIDNGFEPVDRYPIDVTFMWYRKDSKTDPDNIAFAKKFILDGLILAGVLINDGWKQIKSTKDEFYLSDQDYVIVFFD